jgi:tetratricopeptide (TPR) repeat protein
VVAKPNSKTIAIFCLVLSCFGPWALAHLGSHERIHLVNKQLQEDPNNKELLAKRAYLLRSMGHPDEALSELSKLIEKYPAHRPFYFQRALTYKELEAYDQAEADLTQVIQLGTRGASVFSQRAAIRETLKKFQPALEDYELGSQYAQSEDFYLRFGRLHQRSGHWQSAGEVLRKGLEQWPSSVILTKALVRLEAGRENYEQAHRLITAALEKRRFKTPWLLLKAEVFEAAEQKERAIETRRQALKECETRINSGKSSTIHKAYLAEVLLAMGDLQAAEKELEVILQKFPGYFRAVELKQRLESKQKALKAVSRMSKHAGAVSKKRKK